MYDSAQNQASFPERASESSWLISRTLVDRLLRPRGGRGFSEKCGVSKLCPPKIISYEKCTVLRLKVNCKQFFVVILNGICLLTLNIKVNNLKENKDCNYKHSVH